MRHPKQFEVPVGPKIVLKHVLCFHLELDSSFVAAHGMCDDSDGHAAHIAYEIINVNPHHAARSLVQLKVPQLHGALPASWSPGCCSEGNLVSGRQEIVDFVP